MKLRCLVGSHTWNEGCCNRCGKVRDQGHDWKRCKCDRCGKTRDFAHESDSSTCHDWGSSKCTRCNVIFRYIALKHLLTAYKRNGPGYFLPDAKFVMHETNLVSNWNILKELQDWRIMQVLVVSGQVMGFRVNPNSAVAIAEIVREEEEKEKPSRGKRKVA